MVFGANQERISRPFIIQNENLNVPYEDEKGTYIKDDD